VPDADVAAFAQCLRYRETSAYMDVHAGVYTPGSLLSLIELGIKLELVNFEVAYFVPTRRDSLEFHLTLRACAHGDRQEALASVAAARAQLSTADVPDAPAPDAPVLEAPALGGTVLQTLALEETAPEPSALEASAPEPSAPEAAAPAVLAPGEAVAPGLGGPHSGRQGPITFEVSAKERALIIFKRSAMWQLRGLWRKL
jgi:hypothetical protein